MTEHKKYIPTKLQVPSTIPTQIQSIFSPTKKSKTIPFKDYHAKWHTTLKSTILPMLTTSTSPTSSSSSESLLASHVHLLLHHLFSYYDALDHLASSNPKTLPSLLSPSWVNHLQRPFLFLGHLHPYIFINLVRSFLNDEEDSHPNGFLTMDDLAWKDPPEGLLSKIDQIERGLRLMVPSLVNRLNKARCMFAREVAKDWTFEVANGALNAIMEEFSQVFLDANRLRRTVLSDIVGALTLYQGGLFLKGLAQFLIGFQDPDLVKLFKKCKTPITY